MDPILQPLFTAILDGDRSATRKAVRAALQAGAPPGIILSDGMIAAMGEVGHRFERGEYYVPEMLVAARAMKAGLEILRPQLQPGEIQPAGRMVLCTVEGDLHDIGKNLVRMMLEGAGFEVIDLGTDVAPEKIIQQIVASSPQLVGLSALTNTTMLMLKDTITAIQQSGLRERVKILVGGAPVTEQFARQIGADGYAPDASRAAGVAKSLLGQ